MIGRTYMAIDLKSFYASVECTECGLDPLNANLVVADYLSRRLTSFEKIWRFWSPAIV